MELHYAFLKIRFKSSFLCLLYNIVSFHGEVKIQKPVIVEAPAAQLQGKTYDNVNIFDVENNNSILKSNLDIVKF